MRSLLLLVLTATLAACSDDPSASRNHAVPTIETMSETPGDWSALDHMIGRPPFDSGLLENSPITVDLNATLGPSAIAFRNAMADAGPLARRGDLLVSTSASGAAWLVLDPADHAFRAGLRTGNGWREWQTPGADVPRPG